MLANIFGFQRCCAPASGGTLDEAAESPWSLQTDDKLDSVGSPSVGEKLSASATCSTADSSREDEPIGGQGADSVALVTPVEAAAVPQPDSEKPKPKAAAKKVAAKKKAATPAAKQNADVEARKPPLQSEMGKSWEKKGKDGKPKLTPLQKLKEERARQDAKADEMRQVVDDMLAGKLAPEGGGSKGGGKGAGLIRMPSPYERKNTRLMMLEKYRAEYRKIKQQSQGIKGWTQPTQNACVAVTTKQYDANVSAGLQIQGGHQHMRRPQGVKLPRDFRKPVGQMSLQKLNSFDCESDRILISVYGDIFDVSDRPDKYGRDGPYSWMAGHDLTWGFLSGKDIPETVDMLYDLWKMEPEDMREKKINGVIAWVAWYEYEYNNAVGRLAEYDKEVGLRGPPMEQAAEDCSIM